MGLADGLGAAGEDWRIQRRRETLGVVSWSVVSFGGAWSLGHGEDDGA